MIRRVCWLVRSFVCLFVCEFVLVLVNTSWGEYLGNGWRQRLGSNGPPIGNGIMANRMVTCSMT